MSNLPDSITFGVRVDGVDVFFPRADAAVRLSADELFAWVRALEAAARALQALQEGGIVAEQ